MAMAEPVWLEISACKGCCCALQNRHHPLALWRIAGAEHRCRMVQQLVSLQEGADIPPALLQRDGRGPGVPVCIRLSSWEGGRRHRW